MSGVGRGFTAKAKCEASQTAASVDRMACGSGRSILPHYDMGTDGHPVIEVSVVVH